MNNLSGNDLESISAAILSLHTQKGVEEFPTAVLKVVQSVLPCEHSSYNEIKSFDEILPVHTVQKDTLSPVASAHDVVDRPGILNANPPRHRHDNDATGVIPSR